MSVIDALKGVLKLSLIHDGLARGLREASKALDRRQAHMCVLNEACEEEAYKKLVVALCGEHKIPLIKVPDGKQLGEWAGLCEFFVGPLWVWFTGGTYLLTMWERQARLIVRATLARSSTALASSSRTGVRSRRSALFSSTTSRLSSRGIFVSGHLMDTQTTNLPWMSDEDKRACSGWQDGRGSKFRNPSGSAVGISAY